MSPEGEPSLAVGGPAAEAGPAPGPLPAVALLLLAALAAVPRLLNLGSFSLWLDEILQTLQARGTLGELWQNLRGDAVHPPLDGFLTWVLLRLGASEAERRLLPVALGLLGLVLLARWASRHFGTRVASIFGLLAALSAIHVRYSQELRPYALGLFFLSLVLIALDRVLERSGRQGWLLLFVAASGCLYSLYFAAVVAIPALVLLLTRSASSEPAIRARARQCLFWLPVFAGCLALAYAPWLAVLRELPDRPREAAATPWDLALVGRRLEYLTAGGLEGEALSWAGLMAAGLGVVGAAVALGSPHGRAVVAGALAGTVGIEVALWLGDHWSNARYNLVGWPFLTLLVALGTDRLTRLATSVAWQRGVLALLLVLQIGPRWAGVARYDRSGRPDWPRVVALAASVVRPGDALLTANEWTRVCLKYYAETVGSALPEPVSVAGDIDRASRLAEGRCAFLVAAGYPRHGALERWLGSAPRLAREERTDARLFRLMPYEPTKDCIWVVPPALQGEGAPRFTFDPWSLGPNLLAGWSTWERTPAGEGFVWAQGEEAVLALGGMAPAARRLGIRLWPHAVPGREQRLTVVLNGQPLGAAALAPGRQVVELVAPRSLWRVRENVLGFRFAYAVSPREVDGRADHRPLAVAFLSIELDRLEDPQPEDSGESR